MTGIGIGLGLGLGGGPGLDSILAGLASRSQIAGRDGVIACTRATPRRCVFTGAVLPNNTACYGTFDIPGMGSMRFYLAEPTSTNREIYSDVRLSGWGTSEVVKTTNGIWARATETLTSNVHRLLSSSSGSPVGNSTYCFSFIIGPETTSPYVAATVGTAIAPTRLFITWNLATGVVTNAASGGIFPLADGSKLCWATFVTQAAPSTTGIPIGLSRTGTENYLGVGNFIDIRDVVLEAGSIPGPRIDTNNASVSHNADVIDWTPAVPAGSNCAMWGIYIPLGWSTLAGAGMPGGAIPRMFEANADAWRMYTQGNVVSDRTDAGAAVRTSSLSAVDARTHAVGSSFASITAGAYNTVYHELQTGPSSSAGALPYPGATSFRIGNRGGTPDRALRGVMCMGFADGMTAAERAALDTISKTLANKFIL